MACGAADLEALQVLNRYPGLSERDLLICRAYVYGASAGLPTATDAIALAMRDGFAKLSERDLQATYLAVICYGL